jgi:membrane protein DedA with SNARE-associated domain
MDRVDLAMTVNDIIAHYGLFAVFAGSGLEGEPFAIAGGALARRGELPLWQVMAAATLGSSAVDQFWFFLGRHFRDHKWVTSLSKRPAFADAIGLIERRPTVFILLFRFAYGLRAIAPVAIGTSQVRAWRFVALNIIAAAIWGPLFVMVGSLFGSALERYLPHSAATLVIVVMVFALISVFGLRTALRRR